MPAQTQTTAKALPTDLPIRAFSSAGDLEAFLEREHSTAAGIHLKLAKKASGIPSVSGAEAVEIALCYGWIDGRANPFDDSWWLLRFTPRRAKSMWSQKNVNTVARLTMEGRMRPAGIAAVEAAKLDGRWDRAYAGPATMTTPEDLASALSDDPAATTFFESMTKTDRYSLLMRLQTASPKARDQRVRSIVEKLSVDHEKSKGLNTKTSNGVKKAKPKPKSKARTHAPTIISVVTDSIGDPPQISPPRRAGLRSRS